VTKHLHLAQQFKQQYIADSNERPLLVREVLSVWRIFKSELDNLETILHFQYVSGQSLLGVMCLAEVFMQMSSLDILDLSYYGRKSELGACNRITCSVGYYSPTPSSENLELFAISIPSNYERIGRSGLVIVLSVTIFCGDSFEVS
jgi:hypothetical protein